MDNTCVIDLQKKTVTITLPLKPLTLSKSGKSRMVATTSGNMKTDAVIDGKNVVLGVNAYIPE